MIWDKIEMTKVEDDKQNYSFRFRFVRLSVRFSTTWKLDFQSLFMFLEMFLVMWSLSEFAQLNYQKHTDNMAGWRDGRKLTT